MIEAANHKYQVVVIGVSAGGLKALLTILSDLPADFPAAILITQHLSASTQSKLAQLLSKKTKLTVKEAGDKDEIRQGVVLVAPPNYHMMVDFDKRIFLSTEKRINYSRPSIDPLFESAAEIYQEKLVGVILTGANSDGSAGLKKISQWGGATIVQDPSDAEFDNMPLAALEEVQPDYIATIEQISKVIKKMIYNG